MSWNFLEGGHTPGRPFLEHHRIESAQALMKDLNPDIVILNEALWCEYFENYFHDYAHIFSFPYSEGRLYDQNWGNIILSRYPIVKTQAFFIYNRGGLMVTLEHEGHQFQVGTYHPHPSRYPQNKALDFDSLLKLCSLGLPVLIGGDFNTINPEDTPCHQSLSSAFKRFSKNPMEDSARFINAGNPVFDIFKRHGFKDAIPFENRRESMPTDLLTTNKDSGMRIDHILCNSLVKIKNGWIEQSEMSNKSSDHYPVLVDFSF